jgi:hypothetical protein
MKQCKDCNWCGIEDGWNWNPAAASRMCYSPENIDHEMVSASKKWRKRCYFQRADGFIFCRLMKTCGKEGRWFQAKNKFKK